MKKLSCIVMILLLATIIVTQSHNPFISLNSNQMPISFIQSEDPTNSNLTWSARTQQIPQLVENNSIVAGDHVIVNGTFSPTLNVVECEMNIWNGFTFTSTRSIIPVTDPDASFVDSIIYDDFDWIVIKDIEQGLTVNVTCNFTSANCDFMAWPGSMNTSLYSYSKSIVNMASDDKPEHDSFIWEFENDTMVLGCLNTANSSTGSWTADVQIGVNVTTSNTGSTIVMDTYYLESRNQTYNIRVVGTTDTDDTVILGRDNVSICNFFAPDVVVYYPVEINDEFTNITWSCTDLNQDDMNFFTIWLSHNSGITYIYLIGNITQTTLIWDKSSWLEGDYIIRVIAYSCDITSEKCGFDNPPDSYWPGDYSIAFSSYFAHNGIPINTLVVDSINDISYEHLSTGNTVNVTLHFSSWIPSSLDYFVQDNGSIWFEDTIAIDSLTMTFQLDIDGLPVGIHNIEVQLQYGNNPVVSFTVDVIDSDTTDSSQLDLIVYSLSIGAIIGVVVIVVLVLYKKKKNDDASNE